MDNQVIFAIITATGWALAYVGIRKAWVYRGVAQQAAEDADKQHRKLRKALRNYEANEKEMARDIEKLRLAAAGGPEMVEDLRSALVEAAAEIEKQKALAQERLEMLEGVIQEKQIVWRMYRDSTRQAGVAQNWLMREYSTALQTVNAYRRKAGEKEVSAPAQLRALLVEFGAMADSIPDTPPPPQGQDAEKAASKIL